MHDIIYNIFYRADVTSGCYFGRSGGWDGVAIGPHMAQSTRTHSEGCLHLFIEATSCFHSLQDVYIYLRAQAPRLKSEGCKGGIYQSHMLPLQFYRIFTFA